MVSSPFCWWTSVPQMPAMSTLTRMASGPISGISTSRISSGCPYSARTAALQVVGMRLMGDYPPGSYGWSVDAQESSIVLNDDTVEVCAFGRGHEHTQRPDLERLSVAAVER